MKKRRLWALVVLRVEILSGNNEVGGVESRGLQ
jgi:hypothetical protein